MAKGIPRPVGCGGIIRNFHGVGEADFSYPLRNQTNHFAEARAALHIVKLALTIGFNNLWLEGDSLNIINCLNGSILPSWTIDNVVEEIHANLGKFKRVYINHVYREANSIAD